MKVDSIATLILKLSNLYVHQIFMTTYKVMKDHTHISVCDLFNLGHQYNHLTNLHPIHLNVSQHIFFSKEQTYVKILEAQAVHANVANYNRSEEF